MTPTSRRDFLKTATASGLGAMLAAPGAAVPNLALESLSRFRASGANERLIVAVVGLNGRGQVHAQNFARIKNSEVAYLCDVDANVLAKAVKAFSAGEDRVPKAIGDFRRALDDKHVDAIAIATPDHWHAPMAILAMKAGKHVYVEKPCGHNPREGELLVAAQRKYNRVVQMGTQQRSSPRTIDAIHELRAGIIGVPYQVRAWYANTRVGIGHGHVVSAPATLDYELWQGPAPRTPYRDNVIHYNWHWFRRWGTGEVCNNGTHEIDIARLALGVDHPASVSSIGGRFHYADHWEFPDTQQTTFDFPGGRSIVWQGQSCNGLPTFGRSRGTAILGTAGSIVLDRDGYVVYDLKGKVTKENLEPKRGDGIDLVGDDAATMAHMENFAAAIRSGEALRAPIAEGAKSVLLCHLGNIAQFTGRTLRIDPASGRIVGDEDAAKYWTRDYAPGWAPSV